MSTTLEPAIDIPKASCCNPIASPRLDDQAARQLSDDMIILAHPIRLQILALLSGTAGNVCVCDLEAALPVKQPTVSHHLKLLREAGLIDCERRGLWAHYFVRHETLAALRQRIGQSLDQLT